MTTMNDEKELRNEITRYSAAQTILCGRWYKIRERYNQLSCVCSFWGYFWPPLIRVGCLWAKFQIIPHQVLIRFWWICCRINLTIDVATFEYFLVHMSFVDLICMRIALRIRVSNGYDDNRTDVSHRRNVALLITYVSGWSGYRYTF